MVNKAECWEYKGRYYPRKAEALVEELWDLMSYNAPWGTVLDRQKLYHNFYDIKKIVLELEECIDDPMDSMRWRG